MPIPDRPPKASPRIKYFLVVFAAIFTLSFALLNFWGMRPTGHPEIAYEPISTGRSAVMALFLALATAFLSTKKSSA